MTGLRSTGSGTVDGAQLDEIIPFRHRTRGFSFLLFFFPPKAGSNSLRGLGVPPFVIEKRQSFEKIDWLLEPGQEIVWIENFVFVVDSVAPRLLKSAE